MYEMLGNQFFLARNYQKAADQLEKALGKSPGNKAIRRKLIICFIQTGQVEKALQVFLSLIKDDIRFIMDVDPVADDCPCVELVYDLEKRVDPEHPSFRDLTALGMLWLYCNPERSRAYFQKALRCEPDNPVVKSILALINIQLEQPIIKKEREPNS